MDNKLQATKKHLLSKGYEARQWRALAEATQPDIHGQSLSLYNQLLGIPFDWTCVQNYIDDLCKEIQGFHG